jgi:hypothetical protein
METLLDSDTYERKPGYELRGQFTVVMRYFYESRTVDAYKGSGVRSPKIIYLKLLNESR